MKNFKNLNSLPAMNAPSEMVADSGLNSKGVEFVNLLEIDTTHVIPIQPLGGVNTLGNVKPTWAETAAPALLDLLT